MKPVKQRSSSESPRLRENLSELESYNSETEIRSEDTQPPNALPNVSLSIEAGTPVAETVTEPPHQSQGPRSDRVGLDGTLRDYLNFSRCNSGLTTTVSQTANRPVYPLPTSNPQTAPQSYQRAAWFNTGTQSYNNNTGSLNRNTEVVVLTIRRRQRPLLPSNVTPSQAQSELERCRIIYDQEYLNPSDSTLTRRLELTSKIMLFSMALETKYKVLDIWRILEKNKEKHKFLRLTQAFGLLEKYASNLIKNHRPLYWKSVKFTSNLLQAHLLSIDGSLEILAQMGYTVYTGQGVSFPDDVSEPDVEKLKDLAQDLFLARYDIDALVVNKHPHYEIDPPIPAEETELPVLFSTRAQPLAQFPAVVPQLRAQRNENLVQQQRINHMEREPWVPERRLPPNAFRPVMGGSNPMGRADGPFKPSQAEPLWKSSPSGEILRNSDQSQQKVVTTIREPQLVIPGGRGTDSAVFGNRNAVALERTDSPSKSFQTEHQIQSCSGGEEKIQTQELFQMSSADQAESDESEYEDAQDSFQSAAHLPNPMASDNVSVIPSSEPECSLCGESGSVYCGKCKDSFCISCDTAYHKHKSRRDHERRKIAEKKQTQPQSSNELPSNSTSQAAAVNQSSARARSKKPVPTPRRRQASPALVSNSENVGTAQIPPTQLTSEAPRGNEAKLSAPNSRALSEQPSPMSDAVTTVTSPIKDKIEGGDIKSTAECKDRPILRPPRYGSVLTSEGTKSSGVVKESEKLQELSSREDQSSITHENESAGTKQDTSIAKKAKNGAVKSCTNCFCLNDSEATSCVVCGQELTQEVPKPLVIVPEQKMRPFSDVTASAEPRTTVLLQPRSSLVTVNSRAANVERIPFEKLMTERTTNTFATMGTSRPQTYRMGNEGTMGARSPIEMLKPQALSSQQKDVEEQWACEYCTLNNPASVNVCEACCKTRSRTSKTVTPTEGRNKEHTGPSPKTNISHATSSYLPEVQHHLSLGPRVDFSKVTSFEQLAAKGLFADPGTFPFSSKVDQYRPVLPSTVSMYANQQPMTMPPVVTSDPEPKDLLPTMPHIIPNKEKELTEAEIRHKEDIYVEGLQFVEWLREAERAGFTAVELSIATNLGYGESRGPVHWLKTKWHDLIQQVLIEMTKSAPDLGNISPEEARSALIDCTGDVKEAAKKCSQERKKKLSEVMQERGFSRADCVSALDNHDGNVEKAILELQKKAFEPMLERIKNSCLPDDHSPIEHGPAEIMRQLTTQTSQEQQMFEAVVSNKETELERRIRMLFVEKSLQSWGRAETAVKLIDEGFPVEDAVDAAKQCGDFSRSLRYLKQECKVCFETKPMNQMITFLNCQDKFCKECVKQYLEHTINDKNIKFLTCPSCGEPKNLDDDSVATEYFNNMDIIIRDLLDARVHDLYQKKVRDRTLMKEPNFRWCSHCSSGFINENPQQTKMQCPHCKKFTCFRCKKQWEDQHQGISCEQFAAWKEANDPERQATGLAAHLRKNGIECPECKFRYDLAKGGCMHFKCTTCSHEFCSGCYSPFKNGRNCTVSEACANCGLHAHHPRDCLFYMRDRDIEELQKLLRDNDVEYNTEPPQQPGDVDAQNSDDEEQGSEDDEEPQGAAVAQADGYCKVMEQKEGDDGLFDDHCGEVTPPGYGGLCRLHYSEYLVELINNNLIDPAEIMTIDELRVVLKRQYVAVPKKKQNESDENFQLNLLRTVKEKLPLPRKPPRKRVLDDAQDENQLVLEDLPVENAVAPVVDFLDSEDDNDDED